jgi:hypothetical protein
MRPRTAGGPRPLSDWSLFRITYFGGSVLFSRPEVGVPRADQHDRPNLSQSSRIFQKVLAESWKEGDRKTSNETREAPNHSAAITMLAGITTRRSAFMIDSKTATRSTPLR